MIYVSDLVVELVDGEKYVLWYRQDEYKLANALHLTKLKDWNKLQKEYPDNMDYFCRFSGFVYTYDDLKDNIVDIWDGDVE